MPELLEEPGCYKASKAEVQKAELAHLGNKEPLCVSAVGRGRK